MKGINVSVTQIIAQVARDLGVKPSALYMRLRRRRLG
jgi:hypothetical protein